MLFQLFDHIAECLVNFMKEHDVYNQRLPLGFTFSFPLKQIGLTKGLLMQWTKGFNCSGVVGEDVVKMLKEALARRGVSSNIESALVNYEFEGFKGVNCANYNLIFYYDKCSRVTSFMINLNDSVVS